MTVRQRVLWLGNLLYYFRSGLNALLPLQFVALAWLPGTTIHWHHAMWFLPLACCRAILWTGRYSSWSPSMIIAGKLRGLIHAKTILGYLNTKQYHWVPTGSSPRSNTWWDLHGGMVLYLWVIACVALASALHLMPHWNWRASLVFFWLVWEVILCVASITTLFGERDRNLNHFVDRRSQPENDLASQRD